MELTIKGRPEEVVEKSEQIIETLHDFFTPIAPELADSLRKALKAPVVELRNPVLRTLHKKTAEKYDEHIALMLADIDKILDKSGGE